MSAQDGVEAAVNDPPDLILLDNRLPDAAGRDVLRTVALHEATAAILPFVLSADSAAAVADELIATGAVEFGLKPFDVRQFLLRLDSHLAIHDTVVDGNPRQVIDRPARRSIQRWMMQPLPGNCG
jgi:DNA-binding response OmpR family regulator